MIHRGHVPSKAFGDEIGGTVQAQSIPNEMEWIVCSHLDLTTPKAFQVHMIILKVCPLFHGI